MEVLFIYREIDRYRYTVYRCIWVCYEIVSTLEGSNQH